MKKLNKILTAAASGLVLALVSVAPAHALLVGVSNSQSTLDNIATGAFAEILDPNNPVQVANSTVSNLAQQGFTEQRGVLLTSALDVDGGSVAAGNRVDSHMIFLNKSDQTSGTLRSLGVTWEFDGQILGVMSDAGGLKEAASNALLGATSTTYPGAFGNRGMEGADNYFMLGNLLTVDMLVTQPGDWIRVVTVSAVPLPAALPLYGAGVALMGFLGWRKRRKAAA
ncbi:hypothetical protein [Sneathiella aquimaris]|uniref:hypothetical protein n=1 Tax=Sneathiella aquimaris TaxID=2599305 RepID=UPI00146CB282|nr:hypothetical protein [Sneathiella aquimaris]